MHTVLEIIIQVERLLEIFKHLLERIKILLEKLESVSKPQISSSAISITILTTIYFKFYYALDFGKESIIEARPRSKFLPGLPCFCKHFIRGSPLFD